MKDIIFENEDGTQKVIVKAKDNRDDIDFSIQFEPAYGKQNRESTHLKLAETFINSITNSIE